DDKILEVISDIATDPASTRTEGKWGTTRSRGTRDGIEVTAYDNGTRINTGFPTNSSNNGG
ncbi:MAG: hypothetical protein ABIQ95_06795, partial [Bdellovibrionia bacterium]